jgi:photosystem II stability/assembly factor-like uncharacterized protein
MKLLDISFAGLLGAFTLCSGQVEWIPSKGPEGGIIYSMAAKDSTLFLSTFSGYPTGSRLYLSHDLGANWIPFGENMPEPVSSSYLLTASDSSVFLTVRGNAVFRSRDLGKTWKQLKTGLPENHSGAVLSAERILLSPDFGRGALISRDDGETWLLSPYLLGGATALIRFGNALYAGCDLTSYCVDGLYRSDDEGSTWQETGAFPHDIVTSLVSREDEIFAGLSTGRIFRSRDSGQTWQTYETGLPDKLKILFLKGSQESLLLGTDQGVFLRNTGDPQWARRDAGLPDEKAVRAFAAIGRDFFIGQELGVYHSSDRGGNWETANAGISAKTIFKLFGDEDRLLAATNTGISVSPDKGETWLTTKVAGAHFEDDISCMTSIGSVLIAGMTATSGSSAGIYRSTDGGETWGKTLDGRSPTDAVFGLPVLSLVRMDGTLFAGTGHEGLFASADSGKSWNTLDSALSEQVILSLVTDGEKLYAGTQEGVFKSADKGAHWIKASTGLPAIVYYNTLAVSGPNLYTAIYCPRCPSGDGFFGLYRSRDEGMSWQSIRKGLSDETQVNTLTATEAMKFLGTSTGAYVSTDDGDTWDHFATGSPADNGRQVYVSEKTLYATVDGAGVWRASLPEFAYSLGVTTEVRRGKPGMAVRTQPAFSRQGATVHYQVMNAGMVDLGLFTLDGKRVVTLVHGFRTAGRHAEILAHPALRGLHLLRLRTFGAKDATTLWLD